MFELFTFNALRMEGKKSVDDNVVVVFFFFFFVFCCCCFLLRKLGLTFRADRLHEMSQLGLLLQYAKKKKKKKKKKNCQTYFKG